MSQIIFEIKDKVPLNIFFIKPKEIDSEDIHISHMIYLQKELFMPLHILHGSVFLLLLNLSCYKIEKSFQLCFSVLVRLSRRVVASLHDKLSALSPAGGMGWQGTASGRGRQYWAADNPDVSRSP